jgi:phosphotransferase system HPr (HPr) family protein
MSAKKTDAEFLTKELTITNKLGIHARPAAMFVKIANRFACDIFVEKDGEKINGKSIMGLMMLAAGPGSKCFWVKPPSICYCSCFPSWPYVYGGSCRGYPEKTGKAICPWRVWRPQSHWSLDTFQFIQA